LRSGAASDDPEQMRRVLDRLRTLGYVDDADNEALRPDPEKP
jgi:hypothetical protein